MVTAQSQAVNTAIENTQSLCVRLEVKSIDRFQSLSGQLSLVSTKVDLLTERISQVESLRNQVADTTSQIDDLRNKVTEMSTDFGANVSTSLNTLESYGEYRAYTLKLQIRKLESKLSGSRHAEASTNNCEIPATLNEPYSTGGTEIGPQDTAPSGSVSTGLKSSIYDAPETLLGSPIQ
jgi:predicted  nucleic acid-binding Zn-ribbon protein